jgi:uncharacterized protein
MRPGAPFSLLVKPASADCNLRCRYCFYLPKRSLYPGAGVRRMNEEVLERLISSFMATPQEQHAFGWQGGEPTLLGHQFFRAVIRLQRRHGRLGAVVSNGLQTNGTLLDEPLARVLARYRFLVGVSLDGPEEVHDAYRKDAAGGPSHARVLEGVALLRRFGVEHNVLTLVSDANISDGGSLYRYLRDAGFSYHQYIPCVELDTDGEPAAFSVRPEDWGRFLCEVFDAWHEADTSRVSVRLFDSILVRLIEGVANVCSMGCDCRQYLLVEHNGDVYPCDFFVEPSTRLGNIMESEWAELLASPIYESFGRRKSQVNAACTACPYWGLCAGDCQKHRGSLSSDPRRLSCLCAGWRRFFAHALPRLRTMADGLAATRGLERRADGEARRNDPCPCGSGRKYKVCCGAG